ncbi:tetratricopeptide repeat protein [Polynucleobacter alcilacus]|uniref:tetratricopeptide repeat protein n=1 Tax=Polynucleobacter alcilacus TaxID=1819739 RepID=UPI001C0B27A2|nr:tetratricopeptide repeat protein [Polynucleobacter alcilacus]MBU3567574.1 glycosyltransferase family protein [Polynucleobacter alcilacus]
MNPQLGFLLNKSLESLRNLNLESAELYLKQALRLQSNNPHVLRLLGVIAAQRRQYSDALQFLNSSLKVLPKNSLALSNLGNVFLDLKEYNNALDAYDKAIKIDPKYEEAWSNKGNVLYELKRFEEAIAHHDKALSLNPDYAEGWSNKGNILHELKLLDEAIAHHDKALSLRPNYQDAYWNKSLCLLLQGNFENGLPIYESRWDSKIVDEIGGRRTFEKPKWLGVESLQGKTILLYGEQGFGDFIQFCRYTKLVSDLGANVILEVPEALASLMENVEGVSQLVIKGEKLPFFDYQCPLLTLPLALNTTISRIPSYPHYLTSNNNKVFEWKIKLGEKRAKRIGLVWSSMSSFKLDSKRSLMLKDFVKALPIEGFEYICLQKEIKECDKEFFKAYGSIRFFGEELESFADTAALIENLDLVISTCTSIPHLSAALGKETWILLSHVPDWRWLLDRTDSPWYPSVKLFRQPAIGDWDSVFEKVKFDLNHI